MPPRRDRVTMKTFQADGRHMPSSRLRSLAVRPVARLARTAPLHPGIIPGFEKRGDGNRRLGQAQALVECSLELTLRPQPTHFSSLHVRFKDFVGARAPGLALTVPLRPGIDMQRRWKKRALPSVCCWRGEGEVPLQALPCVGHWRPRPG